MIQITVSDDYERQIEDRYLQASYSLWGSLITVNGILLSSISIFSLIKNKISIIFIFLIYFTGISSLALLVFIFMSMKNFYFKFGAKTKELSVENARKRHKIIRITEKIAIILLSIEIILIFILLTNQNAGGGFNLDSIVSYLNANSGGVQALFSILLFLATLIYVIVNTLMHREMVKTRERAERPEISIRLEKITSGHYNLVIENISDIPIYNVSFKTFPVLEVINDLTTADIGFIKNGIKYMAPGQVYKSYFLDYRNLHEQYKNIVFEIEYKNRNNKEFKQNITMNLSVFEYCITLGKPYQEEIISKLNDINNSINDISN